MILLYVHQDNWKTEVINMKNSNFVSTYLNCS